MLRERKEQANKKNLTERTSEVILCVQLIKQRGQTMLQVNILQLQGTGDDEYAYENAAVCASYEDAVEQLAAINADYAEYDNAFFKLDENARIEVHDVVDNNWGY